MKPNDSDERTGEIAGGQHAEIEARLCEQPVAERLSERDQGDDAGEEHDSGVQVGAMRELTLLVGLFALTRGRRFRL